MVCPNLDIQISFWKGLSIATSIVVFMTWLWLSAMIVLAGAEFNAELEHQTAHDTTTGTPKPMGLRGARMADTLGPPAAG